MVLWHPRRSVIYNDAPPSSSSSSSSTSAAASAVSSVRSALAQPQSEMTKWRKTFDNYAKEDSTGAKFLDQDSFVNAIAPKEDFSRIDRSQFGILFKVADRTKAGKISWDDFYLFETILKRPDAEYWIAFQYFDVDGNGNISADEFQNVFSQNLGPGSIPFSFDSDWLKLYLGKRDGNHVLGYNEFTQLMKGLQGERLRQAFKYLDTNLDGFILPDQFKRIILELAGHKLSESVIEKLPTLCTLNPGAGVSYSEVIAFHNVVRSMDILERIIREAVAKSKDGRIDREDFLDHCASATRYSLFTPMEASIIFHFAGGGVKKRLALVDFAALLDPKWRPTAATMTTLPQSQQPQKTYLESFLHSVYNFGLGGIAGSFGATMVYPIDLVKTRMQNQRSGVVGQVLYKNSWDCAQKVFRNEGLRGFYRGLGPQLVGVAPEKAIKLTVNDLVRGYASDPETGRISLGWELLAGGTAGGCQVVFTNPLEIVKIRLQMQGEAAKAEGAAPRGAIHIIRQLGLLGLYKGATACLLRDIPFSAIYFPSYWHFKKDLFGEGYNGKKLSFLETLGAAAMAGMPAAYLSTPADVIKTRLQTEARKGETRYTGVLHAGRTILKEEGFRAMFKGGVARVLRSSPQFGFTLVAYEYLHQFLPYPFAEQPPQLETRLTAAPEDITRVRARNAMKILLDCHSDWGRVNVPANFSAPK
ncbi:mitochondrial carrier [Clavulina sp. PMI_390]|nr:mitochondrial carrier [Clavulina sp. PMI_390]